VNRIGKFFKDMHNGIKSLHGTPKIVVLLVIWLAIMLFFSFFAYSLGQAYKAETVNISGNGYFWSLVRFDSPFYMDIARYGYSAPQFDRGPGMVYLSAAFFPLFSIMIRIFSYPLLGNYRAAALAVCWISLLFALIYLYKLAKLFHDEDTSFRACLFVLLFPTACFFFFPYSEALFLLCAVASFYHARRSSWILAGIWGYLACLNRPLGLAVFAAIALEALRQSGWKPSRLRPRMAAILLAPLGILTYFCYLWWRFGDFFYYFRSQTEGWSSGFRPFGLFSAIKHMVAPEKFTEFARYAYLLFFVFLFVVLLIFVFKRYGYPLGFYGLAYLAIFLLSSPANAPLESVNRHVVLLFPAFMLLANWGKNRDFERLYIIAGTLGLAVFTTLFVLNFFCA
jgi:Mannosyltransferase (PIG-V)